MRDKRTGAAAAQDPDSPINRALAAWDCDIPEGLKPEHVSEGIRAVKITKSKVGSEARKAPTRRGNPEIVKKIGKFNVRYSGGRVEFFDSRYTEGFTPLGQFVSRYDARSLMQRPRGPLALDLGVPAWTVTADQFEEVRSMIARSGDFGPVLNPAKPRGVKYINEARADKKDDPSWIGYAVQKATGGGAYAIFEKKTEAVDYARELANKMGQQMAVVRYRYKVQQ